MGTKVPADGLIPIGVMLCVCSLVSGLSAQARPDASALLGTWTAPELSGRLVTLKFLKGGIFEVEFRGDDGVEVAGRYEVVDNELRMTDEGGVAACLATEYEPGRYLFIIRNGELRLDAIKDGCDGRATILERRAAVKRTWTKKK